MKRSSFMPPDMLSKGSQLVQYFQLNMDPVIVDELAQRYRPVYEKLSPELVQLSAALVFPIYTRTELIAIVVMGHKDKRQIYSDEDIAVFSILSNQMSLAIENAKFYEDMKKTQAQLFQAEKMATIGTMADGVAHQINNRFHCLGLIASDALDTISLKKKNAVDPIRDTALVEELENALQHVQNNVFQGRDVVRGLLQYTRKSEDGFVAIKFSEVFEAAINMVRFKIDTTAFEIVRSYPQELPPIHGNFTQLQEVFFNLLDNAYDAMMQRRSEFPEEDLKPTVVVTARAEADRLRVLFEDNGIGVKDEDMHKLFVPFFTTKATAKKGTGLGLFVIKKIVEENHNGRISFTSAYRQGSKFDILIPLAQT